MYDGNPTSAENLERVARGLKEATQRVEERFTSVGSRLSAVEQEVVRFMDRSGALLPGLGGKSWGQVVSENAEIQRSCKGNVSAGQRSPAIEVTALSGIGGKAITSDCRTSQRGHRLK